MCPKMGMGTSVSTAVSERTAVVIEDYMFDASTVGELQPEESPKDFHDTWDLDGTDFTPEASPDDEGYWDDFENIVLNHNYEELGDNIVTNGTFDSDANWTKADSWSISDGKAICDGSQSGNSELKQQNGVGGVTLNIVNGKTYELTFDVVVQAGAITQVEVGGTYDTNDITSNGTYTRTLTASSTNKRLTITGNSTFEGSVDNVTLKQVDPNDRWSLTNTTISNGVLNFPDNSSAAKFALHSNTSMMDIGGTYEITLTVNKTAGGVLKILSGTGGSDLTPAASVSSSGTHTFIVTNNTNGGRLFLYTTAGENFQGTVDNVSVKDYAIKPLDV